MPLNRFLILLGFVLSAAVATVLLGAILSPGLSREAAVLSFSVAIAAALLARWFLR